MKPLDPTVPPILASAGIPSAVRDVLSGLQQGGFEASLVGGCVRDLLLGKTPKDFDVATSALPQDVQRLFTKVIPTGVLHGTVTVLMRGASIEVTTYRSEGQYLDGRRPASVTFGTSLVEDLSRRDFTINAMAFDPVQRKFQDPFGGSADLASKRIKCVGEPQARFSEDGLRPLRAVRLAAVLGFDLDAATQRAISSSLETFQKIAAERIREEFSKLLVSDRPAVGLELLRSTGLLAAFLPEVMDGIGQFQDSRYAGDVYRHMLATVEFVPPALSLRLAALLHDVAKPRTARKRAAGDGFDFPQHATLGASIAEQILERLKFPRATIDEVCLMVRHHGLEDFDSWSDSALRRFAAAIAPNISSQLDLMQANLRGREVDVQKNIERATQFRERAKRVLQDNPPLTPKSLALDGHAIMEILGVGPSPQVGEATRFLMDQVLENPGLNTVDRLGELLRNWAKSHPA